MDKAQRKVVSVNFSHCIFACVYTWQCRPCCGSA